MTPGHAAALADNPGFEELIAALAAAPAREFPSVEPAVAAAIRFRTERRALLRRGGAVLAAAAALAAAVLLDPGAGAPQAVPSVSPVLPQGPCDLAASTSSTSSTFPLFRFSTSSTLLSRQRPDGSWVADRGGEAAAPAATALAMLELAGSDDPAAAAALARGAAWLRARQNPDGSFGAAPADSAAGAWNLALGATALMRLYQAGGREDLFTPIDGAVGAVRERLARPSSADLPLAAALALADSLEWPDAVAGDLRRAMRRLDVAGETFAARRDALVRLAGRI